MTDETTAVEEAPVKKTKPQPTQEELNAQLVMIEEAMAELNAEKAEFKAQKEPIPAELNDRAMKLRRQRRNVLKALGVYVPLAERPKKEKPPKKAKKIKVESSSEDVEEDEEGDWEE